MKEQRVLDAMQDAQEQAWKNLARYKFFLFGYHAGRWVNYNALLAKPRRRPNPFRSAVKLARQELDGGANRPRTAPATEGAELCGEGGGRG